MEDVQPNARRGVETIKKIRKHELRRLEAMVGVPFTLGSRATSTLKPFDLRFVLTWMEMKLGLV